MTAVIASGYWITAIPRQCLRSRHIFPSTGCHYGVIVK